MRTTLFLSAALILTACGRSTNGPADPAGHDHDANSGHGHSHGTSMRPLDDTLQLTDVLLDKAQAASLQLSTVSPKYRELGGSVRLTGRVMASPVSKAQITSSLAAKVVSVLVDEGAHVRKGQPLVALTDLAFIRMQEEFIAASAQAERADAELRRQRMLLAGEATAQKQLEQAEADFKVLQARRGSLGHQLASLGVDIKKLIASGLEDHFVVRSPMAGRVNGIRIYLGSRVEPTTVLMEVIDLEHFHVHLNAYERDLALLQEGVLFPFTVMNLPGRSFTGELFSIGRTFDTDGRTIPVHAHVVEGSHDLVEGMTVLAEVPIGDERQLAVPDAALARSGDAGYVYIDEGSTESGGRRFRQVEVRPGISRNGWTAIVPAEPLDTTMSIAGNGVFQLRSTLTNNAEP